MLIRVAGMVVVLALGACSGGGKDAPTGLPVSAPSRAVSSGALAVGDGRWIDTGPKNSLESVDGLFQVEESDTRTTRKTESTEVNVHSHYLEAGSSNWMAYRFGGCLMATDGASGVGVTFLSKYPDRDAYYRLRAYNGGDFHISPHGTKITSGDSRSGVQLQPGRWYDFLVEVDASSSSTRILAMVWPQGSPRPSYWQIDCSDSSSTRHTSGGIGLWSMSAGTKFWSDLTVNDYALPLSDAVTGQVVVRGDGSWLSTGAGNSLTESPDLYRGVLLGDQLTFASDSELTNTHAHYRESGADRWADYEITGSLLRQESDAGIGVTFLSGYPEADHYYRLRAFGSNEFRISPHGTGISYGANSSGVVPRNNTWYRYRIQVKAFPDETEIYARVWEAGTSEPTDWPIACYDNSTTRRTVGTVGCWSMGSGSKYWGEMHVDGSVVPWDPASGSGTPADDSGSGTGDSGAGGGELLWVDTGSGYSTTAQTGLFEAASSNGRPVRRTTSTLDNIHSHFVQSGSESWDFYDVSGRLQTTDDRGGVGVTFFSSYPGSAKYYRLRASNRGRFHVTGSGGTSVFGSTGSSVSLRSGEWYRFKIRVFDMPSRTEIRAKVWRENRSEPAGWQIVAYDDSSNRNREGTVGLWSTGAGTKSWGDLRVDDQAIELETSSGGTTTDDPPPTTDDPPPPPPDDTTDDTPGDGDGGGDSPTGDDPAPTPTEIVIAWNEPTTDELGNALHDLAGYLVYLGTRSRSYQEIHESSSTQFEFVNLSSGTYYATVTAVDLVGNESSFSNEIQFSVP